MNSPPLPRLAAAAFLALVLACDHSTPFTAGPGASEADSTFAGGSPRQLTFNTGKDVTPAWTADGASILYSAERPTGDLDRCLVQLPGTGGTIQHSLCGNPLTGADTTDVFTWPAASVEGRLLYTRAWSTIGAINPAHGAIELATVTQPGQAVVLRTYPYTASSGRIYQGVSDLGWLDATTAVFIGDRIDYPRACSSCIPDTLVTGLELVQLDLSSSSPGLTIVPGTDGISSVAPFGSNAVLETIAGSSVVNELTLPGGTGTVIHDFSPDGIARDVHAGGSRLVAVVGGKISFGTDPLLGPVQRDEGGLLHVVDLQSGGDQVLSVPGIFFRNPALRPDGRSLVAEGYRYTVDSLYDLNFNLIAVDTNVSHTSDLWLFDLP